MNIEELNQKGDDLRHNKKYDEALQHYDSALEINPNFVPSLIGRGLVLRTLKRYDEALIAFNRSIEVDSILIKELVKAWNSKGLVLRNLKRYDEALKAFETSTSIDPDNAFSWNGKGLVLLSLQKYTGAIEAYNISLDKNAIKEKPDKRELVFSWNGKGVAFANLGQFDTAIEAFNKSIKLGTRSAFALSGKATVCYSIGKFKKALKLFEESFEFDPNSSFAWNGRGVAFANLGQFDTAIESFKKSILYDPDFIPAYNNLAKLYLDIGDLKNASSISEDSFFKDTKNDSTLFLKGRIELEKQKYDSAIYYFKEAISLSSGSPLILVWEVYAKYLKAEVSFDPNDKKYQDLILSCIRELEKINTFISLDSKTEYLNLTKRKEKMTKRLLTSTQSFLVRCECNSDISMKLLAKITSELLRYNRLRIESYNNYFLGCFYYKLNDYFSAKDKLTNCIMLNSEPKVINSAKQLVEDIWNHKIYTSIPKWWLKSPCYSFRRKITFIFLLFSIFGLLLPESSLSFILIFYNYITKILLLSQPLYEFFDSILLFIFSPFLTVLSFIDWVDNTTQYTLLFILLFFFLVSPCLKSLKGSEVEIELQSPQTFELTLGLIEKNLRDFEKGLNR
jgi:tetratricopeptide (TPR) repeat protein